MRTDNDWTWIEAEGPLEERPAAYLVWTKKGEIWLPKSQIGARKKDPQTGKWCRIEVRRWLAKKEGLTEDDSLRKADLQWQTGVKKSTGEWTKQEDDPTSDPKDLL